MKMLNSLESVFAVVAYHSVAVFKAQISSNIFDFEHEMCNQLAVFLSQRIDAFDVLLRNHQYMYRCLRLQVVEADNLIVLVSYV